ncbi:L-iditol 2-dehydrogenase [Ensifer soli]|uniref:L-iditol 2-dehydrogenase n=1 Tax=Ciceribacter sp. sgz301302 TaxID=3342379 RepID=UPI0035B7C1CA
MQLKGKVAFITGGARGIGAAIATAYVAEGAKVVIADIETEAAAELASRLGASAHAVRLDVRSGDSIAEAVDEAVARFGRLDILVNNAGVFDMAPIAEVTEEMYRRQFDINVGGLIFVTKAVVAKMRLHGEGGSVINLSSQAGRRGEANIVLYCATKAAVISITQSLALELVKEGIRVNAIAPGVVDTPMWERVDALFAKYENRPLGEKKRLVGEAVPAGRMGRPEDFAGPAVFLASDAAGYVVAQTLNVDGGNWMS